jgi:general L-amino acid transport system substrate-binding protein
MLNKRWAVFALGIFVGMFLLVACATTGSTTAPADTGGDAPADAPADEPADAPADAPADEPADAPADEPAQEGGTLAAVQARGVLKCGVNSGLLGFGSIDASGNNAGFDVDFCKAIAAAVFGDADAVEYIALNADQRFPALQTGEIDVLIRNTTWTLTRDTDLGLDFTVVTFYDGQGYMVKADSGFASVEDLDGATICVTSGTTTEANLADDFARRGISYTPNVFSETADTHSTFVDGACDAETSDKSQLAGLRAGEANPDDYVILAETISKEPLGPVVRANDSEWRDVVSWVVFATMEAEDLGINQGNVGDFASSEDVRVQRLLGSGDADLGALLGLPKDFGLQVITAVGSYGDIYTRNIDPIGVPRAGSFNAHWTQGGLIYSPAMR